MTKTAPETTGRARAALVFGKGPDARAVVTAVVAKSRPRSAGRRLTVAGSVAFRPRVIEHLVDTVLPVVDRIMQLLCLPRRSFEVSVVNIGAASTADLGVSVSGFSSDAPVFLALVSAGLKMPLRQDVVTTGHIASPDGDIRSVESIPAKLAAAAELPDVSRFIYPGSDADTSLESLSPVARQHIADSIAEVCIRMRPIGVHDVADLLNETTSDEARALGALRSGFFSAPLESVEDRGIPGRAAQLLGQGNELRLWRALESHLRSGKSRPAKLLLNTWVRHHLQRKHYPTDFGLKLSHLIGSLPQATRRIRVTFPLLSARTCVALSRFATKEDDCDVRRLFEASAGKGLIDRHTPTASSSRRRKGDAATAVDVVLAEISADALAQKIGNPIDAVRARHVLPHVIVASHEEFLDTTCAFYSALVQADVVTPPSERADDLAGGALALVANAFADRGGPEAAETEARYGIHGGMRFVLDLMTEQHKASQQSLHVRRLLKEALDPLDWDARVAFMRALLERIGSALPEDIRSAPPHRFVRKLEPIVLAYVRSVDRVGELLRTL
ncbi:MAG: hypothetical protein J5J06_15725 [Phycisphaerae bacterium]|nr:hypothetical protein [Phycisphaerae bacterium]